MAKLKANLSLMDALAFTSDDLAANRAGHLTHAQRQRQRSRYTRQLLLYGFFGFMVGAFCFSFVSDAAKGIWTSSTLMNFAFSGAATLLIFGFLIFKWWHFSTEIRQNLIRAVIGRVHLTFQNSKSAPRVVQIKELEFLIPEEAVNAFAEGGKYRIFYTPYSKIILSAERYNIEN